MSLENVQQALDYSFKNQSLLIEALTHKSYNKGKKGERVDNQRLEFFGDAVIELAATEYLYERYKSSGEGQLSKLRSSLVCQNSLVKLAQAIFVQSEILISESEEQNGGRDKASTLADVVEALIGAIHQDADYVTAKKVFLSLVEKYLPAVEVLESNLNPKGALQEFTQGEYQLLPEYKLIKRLGTDHQPIFRVGVYLDTKSLAEAEATSLKKAESAAALLALEALRSPL